MPKTLRSFSLEITLSDRFDEYMYKHRMQKSAIVGDLITAWLDKQEGVVPVEEHDTLALLESAVEMSKTIKAIKNLSLSPEVEAEEIAKVTAKYAAKEAAGNDQGTSNHPA